MVRKLFRHEFAAYWRVLLPAWIGLMGAAILGRLVQLFEQETVMYNIVIRSSVFFYGLAIMVSMAFPFVFSIIRFYRNLFTGEGYLSFTLPVTAAQHILVKVTTAVALQLLGLVVAFVSFAVMTAGDLFIEIMKAAFYLLGRVHLELGKHMAIYIVECFVLLIAVLFYSSLYLNACISIGQLARKNRVLAAVGVYFGFYFISQVLGTIAIAVVSFADWGPLVTFIERNPLFFAHVFLCGMIVVAAVMCLVWYLVVHHIIRRRLNLE